LCFNPEELRTNEFFEVDDKYLRMRMQNLNRMHLPQSDRSPHAAARTLKEIYRHCKTSGASDDESEEDEESLERANELFQQQSDEELSNQEVLLDMSSYHSEYDSVDLNEKLKNDDSFKLNTHAF